MTKALRTSARIPINRLADMMGINKRELHRKFDRLAYRVPGLDAHIYRGRFVGGKDVEPRKVDAVAVFCLLAWDERAKGVFKRFAAFRPLFILSKEAQEEAAGEPAPQIAQDESAVDEEEFLIPEEGEDANGAEGGPW